MPTVVTYTRPQWPIIVAALVQQLRLTAGYRNPEKAAAGISVFLGPEIGITSDSIESYVCIGWSGDPDQPTSAGSSKYDPAALDVSRPRDETGDINCRAVVQTGNASDKDLLASLDRCHNIVADVDKLLRITPQLGLPAQVVQWCFMENTNTTMMFNGGSVVMVDFVLQYQARLAATLTTI